MIANDGYLPWVDYTTMTFGLAFEIQFDFEGQVPGQKSWLCELQRKATCRLRPFWCTCWRKFWMISDSGTPSSGLEFDLECQMAGQRLWPCRLLIETSCRLRPGVRSRSRSRSRPESWQRARSRSRSRSRSNCLDSDSGTFCLNLWYKLPMQWRICMHF